VQGFIRTKLFEGETMIGLQLAFQERLASVEMRMNDHRIAR
jgi:hypothetical protein